MNKSTIVVLFISALVILSGCSPQASPHALPIGTTAPVFTLDNALGGRTSLSDYQVTPVLLYFHMAVG